jgi:hypothetical protein
MGRTEIVRWGETRKVVEEFFFWILNKVLSSKIQRLKYFQIEIWTEAKLK